MSKRYRYGASLLLLLLVGHQFTSKNNKLDVTDDYNDDDYENELKEKTAARLRHANRGPASLNRQHFFPHERKDKSFATESGRTFYEEPVEPAHEAEPLMERVVEESLNQDFEENYRTIAYLPESPELEEKFQPNTNNSSESAFVNNAGPTPTSPLSPITPVSPSSKSNSPTTGNNNSDSDLLCSASVGDGTYNSPINVTLSCSSVATIRYCVSEGTCCDPSVGIVYSGPITIGENFKSFCLSFEAEADNGKNVPPINKGYTFNYAAPDLSVSYARLFYQTTQLFSQMALSSNDFGKSQHYAGVINLRSRDPGPLANNLSCDDILTNYSTYTLPSAAVAYPYTNVSGISSASQINLFLTIPELDYGRNYLTSYVVNEDDNLNTCSTGMVTLEDFPYFQAETSHGDPGTQYVREFSGGFSPYGFFEPRTTIYRGPAGSSINQAPSYELRTGMFGIFY